MRIQVIISRFIVTTLIFVMTVSGMLVNVSNVALANSYNTEFIYGDANFSSSVTADDALLVLQHTVHLVYLDEEECLRADVNGDSSTDASDALLILQYVVKLIYSFPVEDYFYEPGHEHSYAPSGEKVYCDKEGFRVFKCYYCNDSYTTVVAPQGHLYHTTSSLNATCTKDGYVEEECERCGDVSRTTIPASGHQPGGWVVVKEATTSSSGLQRRFCTVCNVVVDEESIPVIPKGDEVFYIDIGETDRYGIVKGNFIDSYEDECIAILNKHRAANGLSPVKKSATMQAGTAIRGPELCFKYDHERPNGTRGWTAATGAHGECIAWGMDNPQSVMNAWMKSSAHNAILLTADYKTVSIKCFRGLNTYTNGLTKYNYYWVALFSKKTQ